MVAGHTEDATSSILPNVSDLLKVSCCRYDVRVVLWDFVAVLPLHGKEPEQPESGSGHSPQVG